VVKRVNEALRGTVTFDREEDEISMTIYVESKEYEKNMAVQYLESALAYRLTSVVCKNCGYPIQIPLESCNSYNALIQNGQSLILSSFALTLLRESETVKLSLDI
jgi:hypothetical protein